MRFVLMQSHRDEKKDEKRAKMRGKAQKMEERQP